MYYTDTDMIMKERREKERDKENKRVNVREKKEEKDIRKVPRATYTDLPQYSLEPMS